MQTPLKRLVDEVVSVKFEQANKLKKHWKRNLKKPVNTEKMMLLKFSVVHVYLLLTLKQTREE